LSLAARIASRFWAPSEVPFREVLFDTDLQYRRLLRLLPAVYAWGLFVAFFDTEVSKVLASPLDGPLWPLFFTAWVPWEIAGYAVLGTLAVGGLAAIAAPRRQWGRVAAALGLFLWIGMDLSHSGIAHRSYTTLMLCGFLACIPSLPRPEHATEDLRRRALLLAFGGIAYVLFTYSWAGAVKIWGIVDALVRSDDVIFDFDIVPLHILVRAHRFASPHLLSEFLMNHPAIASMGFFAAIYTETIALAGAYRVHLHRWMIGALAGFHVVTELAMGIIFVQAAGLLALLVVLTPFARDSLRWRAVLAEVPWFGPLLSAALFRVDARGAGRERLTVFADASLAITRPWRDGSRAATALPALAIDTRADPAFAALAREHPALGRPYALVAVSERDGERRVRFDAEAALHASAGLRGGRSLAFLLLAVPVPVSQLVYRAVARIPSGPTGEA